MLPESGDTREAADGNRSQRQRIFDTAGARTKTSRALCPATSAVLDKIPNLFQAFFSILEAGKSIPAHNGPFYGAIRYHLGLLRPLPWHLHVMNRCYKMFLRVAFASKMIKSADQFR